MSMEQIFHNFIAESQEMLQEMEDKLLHLEDSDDLAESINSIFRAAHTIKGSAGLFGLEEIVAFTHIVETVLDDVRSNKLEMNEQLVGEMLQCKDYMLAMLESIVDGQVIIDDGMAQTGSALTQTLNKYLQKDVAAGKNDGALVSIESRSVSSLTKEKSHDLGNESWHISVRFGEDIFRQGMDPLSFIRYLGTMGSILHVVTLFNDLPELETLNPESCYLGFEISFNSDVSKADIENVFAFVRDDCELHIVPPNARIADFISLIENSTSDDVRLGELLVECGTLTEHELEQVLSQQTSDASKDRKMLGEIIVESGMASPEVVGAALNKQSSVKRGRDKQQQTVRVDAEKLDHLINLIGELVIAGAGVESGVRALGNVDILESSLAMIRLVEEVRDGALNLRMVQIGETFNRFNRVVRDVSKELGKTIHLQISGAETELDKTVIEKIGDPLTHLVRNSIDHGIESAEDRIKAGKPAEGTLTLDAYHDSGSIVIEVADDGAGLNRNRILEKAVEKGLVSADAELTDHAIDRLIFEPGFSTASVVSNISGRGVGMDVVRKNIEALNGSIEIESKPGYGTKMIVRLPLTLAIIDGFLVKVGDAVYVIPLDMVVECIEFPEKEKGLMVDRHYLNLRGQVLPFMSLRELFNDTSEQLTERESIVVVQYGHYRAGLVVDALLGEFQTVIKPLNKLFQNLKGISGSTILGNGEVAMIIDVPGMLQKIENTGLLKAG